MSKMELGLKRGIVQLEKNNQLWEVDAKNIIEELYSILGLVTIDIQHVGSTAIKGIFAKPIIDIAVGVEDVNDVLKYIDNLQENRIIYRGSVQPDQLLFVMGDFEQNTRTHHIHVVKYQGEQWKNYIIFRDYLNKVPEDLRRYEALKMKLAKKYPENRVAYTENKKELIMQLIKEAHAFFKNSEIV